MSYIDPKAEERFFYRQKEMLRRLAVSDTPTIFDVGGNVGQSIEAYRRLFPQAAITSFEPLPDCFEKMRNTYHEKTGITLVNIALADTQGKRTFNMTRCRTASSLLLPDKRVQEMSAARNYDFNQVAVNVDTVDEYCKRQQVSMIDILKIDVQGTELAVLRGAETNLSSHHIRIIYCEVLFAENYQGQSDVVALASYLSTFAYVLWDVKPFLFTRSGRLWTANALFVSPETCSTLEEFPEEFPTE